LKSDVPDWNKGGPVALSSSPWELKIFVLKNLVLKNLVLKSGSLNLNNYKNGWKAFFMYSKIINY